MRRDQDGDQYMGIFRHVPTTAGPATVEVERFEKLPPDQLEKHRPYTWLWAEYSVKSETDPAVTGTFRAVNGYWYIGNTRYQYMRDVASAALTG